MKFQWIVEFILKLTILIMDQFIEMQQVFKHIDSQSMKLHNLLRMYLIMWSRDIS